MPAEIARVAPAPGTDAAQVRIERTIIRRASIEIAVANVSVAQQRATAITTSLAGEVGSERISDGWTTLSLRVPTAALDAALDSFAQLGRITRRTVTAEDATATAVDLDARVRNLEAALDRLRALYSRTDDVADIVALEREVARIQGELDSLTARLAVLRGSAAMSEISVGIRQRKVLGPLGLIASGIGWTIGKLFVLK
jgi:hypothetical protein